MPKRVVSVARISDSVMRHRTQALWLRPPDYPQVMSIYINKGNYLPQANIYQKNSTSLKLQPPPSTNLKKEKNFFFF
jgi:hypothetical protein